LPCFHVARLKIFLRTGLDKPLKHPKFASTIRQSTGKLCNAKVAQLVERDLAKVEVAGSNPVFRSTKKAPNPVLFL
jgi:hypothetical protein